MLDMGKDIVLIDITVLGETNLVGKFQGRCVGLASIEEWISLLWVPLVGYSPMIYKFMIGWYGFGFMVPKDA